MSTEMLSRNLKNEKVTSRMTLVQKDLAGIALPEEEDRLHQDPQAWREALSNIYREVCDDFQDKKAQSLQIGNIVARREYEAWKVQANKRKDAVISKIQYVKGLIREQEQPEAGHGQEDRMFGLLAEILTEIRQLRLEVKS